MKSTSVNAITIPNDAIIIYNPTDRRIDGTGHDEATWIAANYGIPLTHIKTYDEDMSGVAHGGGVIVVSHSNGVTLKTARRQDARSSADQVIRCFLQRGLYQRLVTTFFLVNCNASDALGESIYHASNDRLDANRQILTDLGSAPSFNAANLLTDTKVYAPNGTASVSGGGVISVNRNWTNYFWGYDWTLYEA